jgi:hypothetical protein
MQYSTPKWLDYFQLNREGPSSNSLTPRLQSIVSIGPGIDQFEPESSRSSPSQSELAAGLDRTGPYLQLRPSGPVNTMDINSASHKPGDIHNFIRYLKSRPLIKYSLDYLTQRKATLIQIAVMSTVPSVRDHCGRGRTAKSPSVRGQDGNGAVFLRQDGDGRQ